MSAPGGGVAGAKGGLDLESWCEEGGAKATQKQLDAVCSVGPC